MLTSLWWPSNSLRRLLQHPCTSFFQSGTACIPHPSPKIILNSLAALAANAEGSEQHLSVTAFGYSLVWPHWSLPPPWPPSSCHVPGALLEQWALLLNDDIPHTKATLHYFSFQFPFQNYFSFHFHSSLAFPEYSYSGLKRLSRPPAALTPAYIFHCISSWLPLLI